MIYLFDKHKKLKGTVRARHTIALLYERERNGIYSVSAEIPVSLTDKRTVYNYHKKVKGSDFIGHYDREGRFQLHKIAAVDIENTSIFIKGIHLFFDEAKAGAIIRELRFRGREIIDGAREAFYPIGWSVVDFDISDQKDYSFYNVSPLEARAILVETFGYEFDYWLDFDGKNLRNKQIAVKRKIGKETNKRYNYGHNVLSIKVEQDYSEIYTAVIGRGKGEDLDDSDGYGRRIEFTDVEWKKPSKPLDKPKGSRTLIDPTATQLFGYHDGTTVSPRTKVEVFSDIEDESELLQASYEWLMDNNVPKAVFSLNVPDGDGLDLGDSVHVIYRDIDLVKNTRVTKVIDDLVSGNRSVEFGDSAYFETDRRISGLKADLKRVGGSASSRITRLKAEFDKRFDDEVQQWKDDFEQSLIDAEASVEVMRAEMTEEFGAAQKAFEDEFNQSVADAKTHAENTADAKAKQVQDNLDSFAGRHEQIVEELQGNIVGIDGELANARANVSDILGRLTGVDGNISGIQSSLSEVEGTLTNTKTQLESQISDARTELEQSISNTRTALENKIDSTEEALNKVGEDLGTSKTDLQNQLDEARAELDGLEVGGRNYILNSENGIWLWSNNSATQPYSNEEFEEYHLYKTLEPSTGMSTYSNNWITHPIGTKHMDSVEVLSSVDTYAAMNMSDLNNKRFFVPANTWTRIFTERTMTSDRVRVLGIRTDRPVPDGLKYRKYMNHLGHIPMDWTPAPEDTEQKISNINQTITNIEGELSTKVEQTEVDALKGTVTRQETLLTQTSDEVSSKAEKSVVDTLTGRVANAESSVTQNAEEIAKRLTKSVYDEDKKDTDAKITQWTNTATETAEGLERVIGRVSQTEKGVETAQTRIEAEAGRIDGVLSRTSKVEGQVQDAQLAIEANADGLALRATKTEVEQAIDGIEVGGRNYLQNSDFSKGVDVYWRRLNSSPQENFRVEDGMLTVTSNTDSKSDFGRTNFIQENQLEGQEYITVSSSIKGTGSLSIRFGGSNMPIKSIDNDDFKRVVFVIPKANFGNGNLIIATSSGELTFNRIKAETGNRATDWTPAAEDIDASISEVTDRVTTAEAELVVHAGEISQKATQSELDRVTGRVSTAETSITQNANEIARRLVKSDYDSDKQATDAEITKWSNLSSETAEGLEQSISRLSTAEGKVTKAQADIKANADEIATKVSDSEFNSLSGKVSDNSSAITQTANEVKSKVTQAEVDYSMTHIDNGSIKSVKDVASYYNSLSTVTGALLIKTNLTGRAMSRVFIKGYNYATNNSNIDVVISFYNYSTSILNHSYTSTGSKEIERVRLFRDSDGILYILLNDFDSTWKYPAIMVDRFDMSYVTNWSWGEDWEMSVVDSMPEDVAYITEVKGQDYGSIVSKHETDIVQNAKEIALKASQSDLNSVTGRVSTAESQLSVQAGEISSVVGKVDGNTKSISSVLQDTKSIKSTIASIEKDLVSQGSEIDQALDSITNKVWRTDIENIDIGGTNLVPNTNFGSTKYLQGDWRTWGPAKLRDYIQAEGYLLALTDNPNTSSSGTFGIQTPILNKEVVKGKKYTVSFKVNPREPLEKTFGYMYLMNVDGVVKEDGSTGNTGLPNTTVINEGELRYDTYSVVKHEVTFTANFSGRARILLGYNFNPGEYTYMYIKDIKVEEGTKATSYSQAPSDFLQLSQMEITPDYWQLGSTRIDGKSVSSVLRGSPDSIDAIVSEMNLTGNLNVKGQIESISMSAVKAEFADLFAARVRAGAVHADHVEGFTARFEWLYTLNANMEKLVAQNVFTNAVKTLSIDAVEANIGSIRSKILTSDVILSKHINSSNALIDKIFSNSARFERMMSKSAFVNTLNTVSLHANTFSSSYPGSSREITMENGRARFRYGSIVIENASGRRTIIDGKINRSQTMTPRMPRFQSSGVVEDGSWYRSSSTSYVIAHEEYFVHEARHVRVAMAVHRWGMSGWCDGRMETRSGKISNYLTTGNDSSAVYGWLKIDMGEPLDRPVSDSLIYTFKSRNSSQAKRMHLGNRFLTDFPENI